jgi:epoxyqueuosine reductase QueG
MIDMDEVGFYEKLKEMAKREGVDLFGVAEIGAMEREERALFPLLKDHSFGISIGFRLSQGIVDEIVDRPTRRYYYHYRVVNHLLDQTTLKLTSLIQREGYGAIPVPASVITDWKELKGDLSHKLIAYYAGIGWRGKSTLIVHPEFGSGIRLATVLTDLPLKVDRPLDGGCGDCKGCIEGCPSGAIREDGYDKMRCLEQLREFAKREGFGTQYICGICLKVCRPC